MSVGAVLLIFGLVVLVIVVALVVMMARGTRRLD
jgi:hypothetical protein